MRIRISVVVLIGALVVGTGVALLPHNALGLRRSADTAIRDDQYCWALAIGDVCGRGARAAAATAMGALDAAQLARAGRDAAEALRLLNDVMLVHPACALPGWS